MLRLKRPARPLLPLLTGLCLASACGGKEETPEPEPKKKEEPKLPERAEPAELAPEKKLDLSGPKAPEADTVLFAVDGALIPLACFDKASGELRGGADCAERVPEGDPVYVFSEYTQDIDTIGGSKNALCEVTDKPISRAAKTVDGGATYDFAVWPKSAAPLVTATKSDSRSERTLEWDEAEREALMKAITAHAARAAKGEFRPQQKAAFDIDGDGKEELFYAALVAHPTSPDQNLFSGVWMAPGGDMAALRLIDESKRDTDVVLLNGIVDLNGDGKHELWTGVTWDGGSGDRVVVLEGDKAKPLAKWTCGA